MTAAPEAPPPDRPYDRVVVVYNPNSTGHAGERARDLRADLVRRAPDLHVGLVATEYAGHAADIAREEAGRGRPLIVSVSGDGGYHEVVNGAMSAVGDRWVCAVLPAGNANDHRRATEERPLTDAIVEGHVTRIDLLRMRTSGPEQSVVYAHSYIGLGVTPVVAVELEKGGKGSLREVVATVRAFSRFKPFEVTLPDGTVKRIDSLVFANIHEMAKVATLSNETGRPDDGSFEVITLDHGPKWRILATAVRASLRGLGEQPSVQSYAFTITKPMPIQVDGEISDLKAGTTVTVDVAAGALATVL